ncbi:oxysterol-binding protein-related protein 11-like [Uloborus diversus]|uniref:oxysterol-binding protein-related protein 11-like n=1 Tax=Uloborus diversus TaxID=327109 RepID=UPI00240911BA|nr:oxysterol-binding protein-related protein 11-like [Uloborus diversus]
MAYSSKADDINCLINDVPELTEDEKITLITAMKKAEELDAEERNKMSRPLEGQLYKYTNVVKGWQYRWFILIPETGILEYYMLDEVKKKRPRGAIFLAGAVISPSDEDGQSFAISAACGELYKLKANDAKERQFWVNRIRAVAEHHTKNIAEKNPPLPPREYRPALSVIDMKSSNTSSDGHSTWYAGFNANSIIDAHPTRRKVTKRKQAPADAHNAAVHSASSIAEALNNVRDMLCQTEDFNSTLSNKIEALPYSGNGPKCCDTHLLLLKATSAATLRTLQQCYSVLQNQQVAVNFPKSLIDSKPDKIFLRSLSNQSSSPQRSRETSVSIDPSGEVSDNEDIKEKEASIEGDRHTVIMNLMSHLKLGTDLTTVVLPSFILEPRSLLEMFADCMRHPDFLIRIPDCQSPKLRMLAAVQWYLTSFHAGREASASQKPYNPILGEMFRCSWNVYDDDHESPEKLYKVTYVSEQVSHHPPVSAFYVECPKKKISVSAHLSVKSNFLTSYVAVNFIGEVVLHLPTYGETYVFTLPSAYVRCILTVPWIELGGRISVTCSASDYSASVTFQTKPQQAGTPHRISGEIKHQNDTAYRISGEWNNSIQFVSNEGVVESINVPELKRFRKHVRPLDQQDTFESRKLWQLVTKALIDEDFVKANEEKQKLEDQQREEEKKRVASNTEYNGKLFYKENDAWKYKYPLP